jgi:hypothetical protein
MALLTVCGRVRVVLSSPEPASHSLTMVCCWSTPRFSLSHVCADAAGTIYDIQQGPSPSTISFVYQAPYYLPVTPAVVAVTARLPCSGIGCASEIQIVDATLSMPYEGSYNIGEVEIYGDYTFTVQVNNYQPQLTVYLTNGYGRSCSCRADPWVCRYGNVPWITSVAVDSSQPVGYEGVFVPVTVNLDYNQLGYQSGSVQICANTCTQQCVGLDVTLTGIGAFAERFVACA